MERISTIQTASVITQPVDATERLTLIEKLEQEVKRLSDLKAKENPDSLGYMFLGHHIVATVNAINIVKQHKCTWQGTFSKAEETIYYTLSCGNKYFDDCLGADVESFKYCPFCGGEIEFSEVQDD